MNTTTTSTPESPAIKAAGEAINKARFLSNTSDEDVARLAINAYEEWIDTAGHLDHLAECDRLRELERKAA